MQKGGHSSQGEFLAVHGNKAPLLPQVQTTTVFSKEYENIPQMSISICLWSQTEWRNEQVPLGIILSIMFSYHFL